MNYRRLLLRSNVVKGGILPTGRVTGRSVNTLLRHRIQETSRERYYDRRSLMLFRLLKTCGGNTGFRGKSRLDQRNTHKRTEGRLMRVVLCKPRKDGTRRNVGTSRRVSTLFNLHNAMGIRRSKSGITAGLDGAIRVNDDSYAGLRSYHLLRVRLRKLTAVGRNHRNVNGG